MLSLLIVQCLFDKIKTYISEGPQSVTLTHLFTRYFSLANYQYVSAVNSHRTWSQQNITQLAAKYIKKGNFTNHSIQTAITLSTDNSVNRCLQTSTCLLRFDSSNEVCAWQTFKTMLIFLHLKRNHHSKKCRKQFELDCDSAGLVGFSPVTNTAYGLLHFRDFKAMF